MMGQPWATVSTACGGQPPGMLRCFGRGVVAASAASDCGGGVAVVSSLVGFGAVVGPRVVPTLKKTRRQQNNGDVVTFRKPRGGDMTSRLQKRGEHSAAACGRLSSAAAAAAERTPLGGNGNGSSNDWGAARRQPRQHQHQLESGSGRVRVVVKRRLSRGLNHHHQAREEGECSEEEDDDDAEAIRMHDEEEEEEEETETKWRSAVAQEEQHPKRRRGRRRPGFDAKMFGLHQLAMGAAMATAAFFMIPAAGNVHFGPFVHVFVHSFVHWSIHSSIHRSIGPLIHPLTHPLIHPHTHPHTHHPLTHSLPTVVSRHNLTTHNLFRASAHNKQQQPTSAPVYNTCVPRLSASS